jgi:hypothetical protein
MDMHQKIGKWCAHEASLQVSFSETKEDRENDPRNVQGEEGVF